MEDKRWARSSPIPETDRTQLSVGFGHNGSKWVAKGGAVGARRVITWLTMMCTTQADARRPMTIKEGRRHDRHPTLFLWLLHASLPYELFLSSTFVRISIIPAHHRILPTLT